MIFGNTNKLEDLKIETVDWCGSNEGKIMLVVLGKMEKKLFLCRSK